MIVSSCACTPVAGVCPTTPAPFPIIFNQLTEFYETLYELQAIWEYPTFAEACFQFVTINNGSRANFSDGGDIGRINIYARSWSFTW